MLARKTPRVLYYPSVAYDLTQLALFPLNAAISGLCYLQPKKSVWSEPGYQDLPLTGTGRSLAQLRADVLDGDGVVNEEDLVRLYDSLPAVSAEEDLIGRSWRGRIVRTNASVLDVAEHLLVRPLQRLGFDWGKRYRTAHKGDPLLVRWRDKLYFPLPAWGNVGMTNITWRGTSTATMNYDHQPWKDYFKLLSDEHGQTVLLGVWTHKHIAGGWFTLTLDHGVPT
ncbi:MAG: DUF4334 domain-containing protein [Myxococcales bacterium]|nr:DUF4334 domain-containing protein [Myxococcales bacterium]MCB9629551.1 DUF4334 domain-containing protein [Sandaracinaceae bacterium]